MPTTASWPQCQISAFRSPVPTSRKPPQGLTIEELDRALAAYGITNAGPPVEQEQAERQAGQLA
jgi:hypothetical protein